MFLYLLILVSSIIIGVIVGIIWGLLWAKAYEKLENSKIGTILAHIIGLIGWGTLTTLGIYCAKLAINLYIDDPIANLFSLIAFGAMYSVSLLAGIVGAISGP